MDLRLELSVTAPTDDRFALDSTAVLGGFSELGVPTLGARAVKYRGRAERQAGKGAALLPECDIDQRLTRRGRP